LPPEFAHAIPVDLKHNLKLVTSNNVNSTGIAWENSGGNFSQTIFRTDIGGARSDLMFAIGNNADIDLLTPALRIVGSAADEGKVQILTSLGIGTIPGSALEISADVPGNVGGFPAGQLMVRNSGAVANDNAVITGHNSFGGNTQLWYLGSSSGSNQNITFLNRQNADLSLGTNGLARLTIDSAGLVGIGQAPGTEILEITGNFKTTGFILLGLLNGSPSVEGKLFYDTDDKALSLKTDIAGSTQSVGQEFWFRVINKTGVTIPDGTVVFVSGVDVPSGRATVAPAKADIIETANPVGFATNEMLDGAEGFVTAMGFVNDVDTSAFSVADQLFLSDTVAGGLTATQPLISVPMAIVTKVGVTDGQLGTSIPRNFPESPFFLQASDSTNQKPTVTTPVAVTFDTNDDIRGISHSTSVAPEDIIIDFSGTYTFFIQPQVERTSGASAEEFHCWVRVGTDDKGGVTAVSVANPSQITTDAPHGLATGQTVDLTNLTTTPDINGQHVITVTGASTFTIPVNVTVVTDGVGDWRRVLDVNDDLTNSNVELRVSGSNDADVIPLIFTKDFVKGEKVNVMQSVSNSGNGIGLVAKTPAGEPAIPSIILAVNKN